MAARELHVLGTASQAPSRSRNHNGYLLRWDGEGLLFDPGEGTQRQMLLAGVSSAAVTRICITHLHGDHCLGLPGVLQRMSLDRTRHIVDVCYPSGSADTFERLRHCALYHDVVRVRERRAGPGVTLLAEAPPFRLEARPLDHNVPTVGYRLAEPDGRRMLPARLAALGIAGPDVGLLQRQGALQVGGRRVTLEETSEPRPGQRFAFVMDTRLCDQAFALAEGADMLVCESTFLSADARLAREYGHMTTADAGALAAGAGARMLVLSHFSRRYGEEDGRRFADEAAVAFGGDIVAARDLTSVPVPARR